MHVDAMEIREPVIPLCPLCRCGDSLGTELTWEE
jgi:predicted nucleic acid-binding Zn ribbon protein